MRTDKLLMPNVYSINHVIGLFDAKDAVKEISDEEGFGNKVKKTGERLLDYAMPRQEDYTQRDAVDRMFESDMKKADLNLKKKRAEHKAKLIKKGWDEEKAQSAANKEYPSPKARYNQLKKAFTNKDGSIDWVAIEKAYKNYLEEYK